MPDRKGYVHQKLIDLFETMIQQQVDEFKIQLDSNQMEEQANQTVQDPLLLIKEQVCKYYHMPVSDIMGRNRVADINLTRQVCFWVSRYLPNFFSLTLIGSYYNRDHATVINGVKRIESLYSVDCNFRQDIENILLTLQGKGIDVGDHFKMMSRIKILK
jgi:chromosomal replication initiation ATPase DnaA